MNKNDYVVIMAGGTGTRLWPVSTTKKPKQFHDLLGVGKSLLQLTYERFSKQFSAENIFVVTNSIYKEIVEEQIPALGEQQLLLEPYKRNTAPCIAYAAYKIERINPNASMVIAPADHLILKEDKFHESIERAIKSSRENDQLITLGMHPNRPETGYGYIQYLEGKEEIKKVKTFTEKPEIGLARKFLESGDFVWNAGIFVWSVSSIIKAFENYLPDLSEIFSEGKDHFFQGKEQEFINAAYSQCNNVSIDYGIMEKADNVFVMLADIGWSDLGNWESLHEIKDKDKNDNAVTENVMTFNATGNVISADQSKLVVVQDLHDFLVAEEDGVILICRKNAEKEIKEIVNAVKLEKGDKFI